MVTTLAQRATPRVAAVAAAAAISIWVPAAHAAPGSLTIKNADPPGNNGTVKVAKSGDLDRIPNNTPHPGCTFVIQWYGYDAGADVISHVTFTSWAPTDDAKLTVNGPATVPVGQDAASGAGTATGLDATASYTLSFSGGAPAKQGYHVRLTVATPHSLGNDTKSKMFWVGPCTTTPGSGSSTPPGSGPAAPPFAGSQIVPLTPPKSPTMQKVKQKAKHIKAPTVVTAGQNAASTASPSSARWGALGLASLGAAMLAGAGFVWRRRGV